MKPSTLFLGGILAYGVGVLLYVTLVFSILVHWRPPVRPLLVAEIAVCIVGSILFVASVVWTLWREDAEL